MNVYIALTSAVFGLLCITILAYNVSVRNKIYYKVVCLICAIMAMLTATAIMLFLYTLDKIINQL